jgi:hypothetical protein
MMMKNTGEIDHSDKTENVRRSNGGWGWGVERGGIMGWTFYNIEQTSKKLLI